MAELVDFNGGMWKPVVEADYSRMHLGYAPGGAQDRFSCGVVNRLLPNAQVYELTFAMPTVRVLRDCVALIGGAPVTGMPEWEVVAFKAGQEVRLKRSGMGCRAYFAVAEEGEVGRKREFGDAAMDWAPRWGRLRIERGPEWWDGVEEELCGRVWTVGADSSGMGVRLGGGRVTPPAGTGFDLLSSPVQDGTVQATASGLIALLRERGTIGGYPRVATVIDVDVDRLAQFRPGNALRFELVESEEAQRLAARQAEVLAGIC